MTQHSHSFLRNVWYYALPSHQLKPGRTIAKTFLNEPVLLGRTRAGEVFALRNLCPHRGIPLSCGRFDGETVECFFHGWQFNTTGQCTAIPALTDDQIHQVNLFQVPSYQTKEVQGNIWIYIPANQSTTSIEVDVPWVPGFGDCLHQAAVTVKFPGHIDHVVYGFLDLAHVPFIHRSWWWRSDTVDSRLSNREKLFVPSPYGFTRCRHISGQPNNIFYRLIGHAPEVEIIFQLPGVRIERITTKQHTVCNMTVATPVNDTETEVTTLFYTTLPWFNLLKPAFFPFIHAFINQDRSAVVKQKIGLQYNPSLTLVRDADALALWYYQLKAEFNRAIAENRPFINPIKAQALNVRT